MSTPLDQPGRLMIQPLNALYLCCPIQRLRSFDSLSPLSIERHCPSRGSDLTLSCNTTQGPFLEELMADLSRVPPPPPGRAAVAFRLNPRFTALSTRNILVRPPRHVDMSIIDVPLRFVFLTFGAEQVGASFCTL